MRSRKILRCILALLTILLSIPSIASTLLGYTAPGNSYALIETRNFTNDQWSAQAFTTFSGIKLTSIELGLSGSVSNDTILTVRLVRGVLSDGMVGGGTTVFQTDLPVAFAPQIYSIPTSMTIAPGNYYLLVNNLGLSDGGWAFGASPIAGSYGSIGDYFYCLSSGCNDSDPIGSTFKLWNPAVGASGDFRLIGEPVPEPASMLFFATALAGFKAARRRFKN